MQPEEHFLVRSPTDLIIQCRCICDPDCEYKTNRQCCCCEFAMIVNNLKNNNACRLEIDMFLEKHGFENPVEELLRKRVVPSTIQTHIAEMLENYCNSSFIISKEQLQQELSDQTRIY